MVESVHVVSMPNQGRSWGAYEQGSERKYILVTLGDGTVVKMKYIHNSIGTTLTIESKGRKQIYGNLERGGTLLATGPSTDLQVKIDTHHSLSAGIFSFSDGSSFTKADFNHGQFSSFNLFGCGRTTATSLQISS